MFRCEVRLYRRFDGMAVCDDDPCPEQHSAGMVAVCRARKNGAERSEVKEIQSGRQNQARFCLRVCGPRVR